MNAATIEMRRHPDAGWMHATHPDAARWTARAAWARAIELGRTGRARTLVAAAAGELGYRRLFLLERSLRIPLPKLSSEVALDCAVLDDPAEPELLLPALDAEEATRRLAAGARCYLARHDGLPVSLTWAWHGAGPVPYLDATLEAGPGSIVLFDSYTEPTMRGRGVSPALGGWMLADLADRGHDRVLTCVLPENRRSLRARAKLGFLRVALAGYLGLGRRRHHFIRPLRGRHGT